MTVAKNRAYAANSTTRAVQMGGYTGSNSNVIDYVTIASTGNATDFGDMTQAGGQGAAICNGHGGLS